ANRYRVGDRAFLDRLRERVMVVTGDQGCALRRVAIMPDHMHVALRGNPELSPEEIALGLQNASADAAGCRLWEYSFYVGTFGEYDKAAVKIERLPPPAQGRRAAGAVRSHPACPAGGGESRSLDILPDLIHAVLR
ncbi:MAG: transposase, partial [Kiritimatiellia bacterium]|nr:transposase [Kiritimatiellia bacterium]